MTVLNVDEIIARNKMLTSKILTIYWLKQDISSCITTISSIWMKKTRQKFTDSLTKLNFSMKYSSIEKDKIYYLKEIWFYGVNMASHIYYLKLLTNRYIKTVLTARKVNCKPTVLNYPFQNHVSAILNCRRAERRVLCPPNKRLSKVNPY